MSMLRLVLRLLLLITELCLSSEVSQKSFGNARRKCCTTNADCDLSSVCRKQLCQDPCSNIPCGVNALCHVINQEPRCDCAPEYELVDGECQQETPSSFGRKCYTNAQCDSTSSCMLGECVNPCLESNCGPNTLCQVVDHKKECKCAPGFVDDGSGCVQQTGSGKRLIGDKVFLKVNGVIHKKLFWLGTEKVNFTSAINGCYSRSMRLASIDSGEEQNTLETIIQQSGISQSDRVWTSGYCFDRALLWITSGRVISSLLLEGLTPALYAPPECPPHEPCGSSCVVTSGNGGWHLSSCQEGNYYACEYYKEDR